MQKRFISVLSIIALFVSIAASITFYQNQKMIANNHESNNIDVNSNMIQKNEHDYAKNLIKPRIGQPIKEFTLSAKESSIMINDKTTMPVWAYNGTVPGPEIRVNQGDFVRVKLTNKLKNPVTIHWHGYPLKSSMDGVPGINQDAIQPGETFTYEFSADVAGTYWYHSHQEGAKQVDKGLYGALIVESKDKKNVNRDYTLMLDEWIESTKGSDSGMNMGEHGSTDEDKMMAEMYNIYTVNGKSGNLIAPLKVKEGDVVRLRFINAGYRIHGVHIPNQDIKVISTDGQDISGAGFIKNQVLLISPGERYDVEFTVKGNNNFIIDLHDDNLYNEQIKIPVIIEGGSGIFEVENKDNIYPVFDLMNYGVLDKDNAKFSLNQSYNVDYRVELDKSSDPSVQNYTINGKIFNELPAIKLKTGDLVKLTYYNKSNVDHPMHLHGHFFQILSKNGKAPTGTIVKDTLLIRPGEEYTVAFKADNSGNWVQHCHELHHAAGGMMQKIEYTDFKSNYIPSLENDINKPE